ncbi:MAG: hypothetical protein SFU85_08595 [Candidatus Methylacidiphilales bacterium]|nr:hypothetical protein [Candidatus Methylacidiphilales bacterium]
MKPSLRLALSLGLFLLLSLAATPAHACAMCFGAKGDPVNEAIGMSIFFMIGVIAFVLLAIVGFFASFLIHAARHPVEDPPTGTA